jgi:hypothetical protein
MKLAFFLWKGISSYIKEEGPALAGLEYTYTHTHTSSVPSIQISNTRRASDALKKKSCSDDAKTAEIIH